MRHPGLLLRAIRRELGLSQEELARVAGVARSTVERIESPRSGCQVFTFRRILQSVGYDVVVTAPDGHVVAPDDEHDWRRQRDGRRFPAHLPGWGPVRPWDGWWGWGRIAWDGGAYRIPEWTFYHPDERRERMLAERYRILDAARAQEPASDPPPDPGAAADPAAAGQP